MNVLPLRPSLSPIRHSWTEVFAALRRKPLAKRRLGLALAVSLTGLMAPDSARAANGAWSDFPLDADWANASNWLGSVPGITYTSGNVVDASIATFDQPIVTIGGAANPIQIDLNRLIGGITFDTGAGAYVFSGNQLSVSHNRAIVVNAGVTNAQTFNNDILVRLPSSTDGIYTLRNNATSSSGILVFNGTITSGAASSRPLTLNLDGSNTGSNLIAGTITHGGGNRIDLVKSGAGTWILSGTNDFGSNTSSTSAGSVTIDGGTLVVKNNAALSTNSTANAIAVAINNSAVLEINGSGLTMDNGLSLNLNNGGTIRSNGTNATNGRINVSTAAGSSVTISTVSVADVFTIGNASNDFTGGSSTAVVHISGPGTVVQNVASNYVGSWAVDGGTLRLGAATALGTASAMSVASGAKLQLNGNSYAFTSLTGTGTIENGSAATNATLTVNNASALTFGGLLQNGAAATLGLTKGGNGTLTLTNQNTYTGATTVQGGTLKLDFTAVGAPTTNIISSSSALTLGGAALQVVGASASSTQTFSSLSLTNGLSAISASNGATVNLGAISSVAQGGLLRIDGPATINASGNVAATGTVTTTTAGNGTSGALGSYFTPAAAGGYATVGLYDFATTNLAGSGGAGTSPYTIIGGSQVTGFYTSTVPTSTTTVGNWDVTVNATVGSGGEKRMSTMRFNTPTATTVTLTNAATGTLLTGNAILVTPNMGANNATIQSTGAGASEAVWQIMRVTSPSGFQEGIIWQNNTLGFLVFNSRISDGRDASDASSLIKAGAGTLVLGNAANTYSGATYINEGSVLITSNANLGAVATGAAVNLNNGALFANASFSLDNAGANFRPINLSGTGGTLSASTGNVLTVSGVVAGTGALAIGSGTLVGTGAGTANTTALVGNGTVALTGANTYTGATSVNAGKLLVSGSISGSVTTVNSGGTLGGTGSLGGTILNAGGAIEAGSMTDDLAATSFVWNGETSGTFAQMKFELSVVDSTSDKFTLSGAFTKGTGSVFLFDFQGGGLASGSYTLMTFNTQSGFSFGDFSYTNLASGLSGSFDLQSNALVFTVVPEPSAAVSTLGGLGCLLGWFRLRRRNHHTAGRI